LNVSSIAEVEENDQTLLTPVSSNPANPIGDEPMDVSNGILSNPDLTRNHINHDECRCSPIKNNGGGALEQVRENDVLVLPDDASHTKIMRAACQKQSLLLRLFESSVFNMSIAVQYLFNSKESGVLTYLGRFENFHIFLSVYTC